MVPYHIVVDERSKRSTDIPGKTQPRSISSLLYLGSLGISSAGILPTPFITLLY